MSEAGTSAIDSARTETLGITHSVCPECRELVPAKVVSDGRDVFLLKFCPRHGETEAYVWRGVDDYLSTQRQVKPAWRPREFAGDSSLPCPTGCGFCDRHEQHLCLPIIEITSRCDLACPVCLVDAGADWSMSLGEFRAILDGLIRAEGQVDVLNLSGGEPLLHPDLLAFVDEALARREIVRVSISTNGLRLLEDRSLPPLLKERDVVVSLQFDGFSDSIYEVLRGRPLLDEKLRVLETLGESGIATSLTMTAAGGINDDQLGQMLELLFSRQHIVSMMIQPLCFTGRASSMKGRARRLTIPDVVRLLGEAGHPDVNADDFVPLPCSHPLCFSLAFYLMLEDGDAVSFNRLAKADQMLESMANRLLFGLDSEEHEQLREMIYEIWSGPVKGVQDPEAVLNTLRAILRELSREGTSSDCSCFDPRKALSLAERHVKSIFIHAFQDEETFDLARVRRCCQAYPQPDGRLIPVCAHNVLRHRDSPAGRSSGFREQGSWARTDDRPRLARAKEDNDA